MTVSNNIADSDTDNTGDGGGVDRGNGVAYLRNTILAGNTDSSPTTKKYDCSGTFTSQGYNLVQSTTGCTLSGDTTGNITGQSANLAALTNNGGSTLTHAPNTSSPVIDAGNPTVCVTIDQRFYPRPFNGRCDMGAYEVGAQGVVSSSVTFIAYNYDGLYRLANANYSSGQVFSYTYDAMGNTLQMMKAAAGQTATTTYTYNNGNQLVTALASDNPTTWHYTYDADGRLTDITPNDTSPANGARRYSYNATGYLLKAELHNGTAYQPQAEMQYNGAGGRATMTAWQSGISATSTYALDLTKNGRVLSANSGGSVTAYLYGSNGPLAELTTSWAYYLSDGTNTVRQLTNGAGAVTLARAYTPWGEVLTQSGTGNFAWGYFGGLMDAATGLLYVGSGQYYDPATGRFLTPVNQSGPNPYVPWRSDPLGAMVAPFGLLALLGRKRKKGKYDQLLLVLVVLAGVSMGLAACGTPPPPPEPTEEEEPPTQPPSPSPTDTPPPPTSTNTSTATATPTSSYTPTPLPTQTPCPTDTPTSTPPPPLTDVQYLALSAFSESSDGQHPDEVVRRYIRVYMYNMGRYWHGDAFQEIEHTGGTLGDPNNSPPTWWQTLASFAGIQRSQWTTVGTKYTQEERRTWAWKIYNHYASGLSTFSPRFLEVERLVTEELTQNPGGIFDPLYSMFNAASIAPRTARGWHEPPFSSVEELHATLQINFEKYRDGRSSPDPYHSYPAHPDFKFDFVEVPQFSFVLIVGSDTCIAGANGCGANYP